MGCDVHMFAERRGPDGKWQVIQPPRGRGIAFNEAMKLTGAAYRAYCDSQPAPYRYEHEPSDDDDGLERWFTDRNYALFAILADVRNREDYRPIAKPRGVPDDASPEYLAEVERYGIDGHSHSWLTVAEVRAWLAAHGKDPIACSGVVSGPAYEALLRDGGRPESWSQSIGGANIVTVDSYDYKDIADSAKTRGPGVCGRETDIFVKGRDLPFGYRLGHPETRFDDADYRVYVKCAWVETYDQDLGNFVKLLGEIEDFYPGETRLVFYFDN